MTGTPPSTIDHGPSKLLPDEAVVIAEWSDELEDCESHLTTEEIAESPDIDLD